MNFTNLKLFKPKMEYRRFGKTNKNISVITLGGMRFKHGWTAPRHNLPTDSIEQCIDTVTQAFEQGINHIETAHGYIKSEHLYGKVLNEILKTPRSSYHLMTKGNPTTEDGTYRLVEEQLKALQTNYFDFYAWHGINSAEQLELLKKPNGPIKALQKLKEQGVIHHIGFSTHARLQVILDAIATDFFEFVNLHYYYFFQRHKPAIDLAASKDMGVFIISPNDKGGQLFNPPQLLKDICAPLNPLQWNARFCLGHKAIHTLTFGLPKTAQFSDIQGIFPTSVPLADADQKIKETLDARVQLDPYAYYEGYDMENDPSGINIPEVLRFRKMLKCYDMETFGKYRYNMFEPHDNWLNGQFATEEFLQKVDLTKCPPHIPIVELLRETHQALYNPKK